MGVYRTRDQDIMQNQPLIYRKIISFMTNKSLVSIVAFSGISKHYSIKSQQIRTGFQSVPVQLPDNYDKVLYDGTAYPEPIMDTHWTDLGRGTPLYSVTFGQLFVFCSTYGSSHFNSYMFPGGFQLNGEFLEMRYHPFGAQYLERGGDPQNIPY